jgi:hypothetical protein
VTVEPEAFGDGLGGFGHRLLVQRLAQRRVDCVVVGSFDGLLLGRADHHDDFAFWRCVGVARGERVERAGDAFFV